MHGYAIHLTKRKEFPVERELKLCPLFVMSQSTQITSKVVIATC